MYYIFLDLKHYSSHCPDDLKLQRKQKKHSRQEDKNDAGFIAGWLQSANVCGRIVPCRVVATHRFFQENNGSLVVRRMNRVVNNNVSSGVFVCSCGRGGWKVHEEFGRMDLFLLLPRG